MYGLPVDLPLYFLRQRDIFETGEDPRRNIVRAFYRVAPTYLDKLL